MKQKKKTVQIASCFITICLAFLNAGCIYAQEKDTLSVPSYKLKDYFPVGITIGVDRSIVSNEPNIGGWAVRQKSFNAPYIGLNANLWKNEKWNIRLGGRYRWYNIFIEDRFPRDIFDPPTDFDQVIQAGGDEVDLKFNISGEYIFKAAPKYDWFVGLGVEATSYTGGFEDTNNIVDVGTTTNEFILNSGSKNLFWGTNFDVGVNMKSYYLLYRLMLTYHHNFSAPTESIVMTTSSNTGAFETSTATKKQIGNYVGLGLTIHPSKNLFKDKPREYEEANRQNRLRLKQESIYEQYYAKLGVSYGINMHSVERNMSNVGFGNASISGSNTSSIGLNWHYHNRKNFTLSWALEYHRVSSNISFNVNTNITGNNNEYQINQKLSALNGGGIAHYFDYLYPLTESFSLNAGIGAKIRYINSKEQFFEYEFPEATASLEYGRNFFLDALISPSIGVDWNTDYMLLRFKLYADINTWNAIRTEFVQRATNSERDFWTNEGFKRTSFGLKLHFYPKKGLFKKSR